MGMFNSFCKHMRNRSFQYMIRSTYTMFEDTKPGRDSYSYNVPKEQSKRKKKSCVRAKVPCKPLDKNGKPIEQGDCVLYNGKKKVVSRTTPKMVVLSDGTKCMANKVIDLA